MYGCGELEVQIEGRATEGSSGRGQRRKGLSFAIPRQL